MSLTFRTVIRSVILSFVSYCILTDCRITQRVMDAYSVDEPDHRSSDFQYIYKILISIIVTTYIHIFQSFRLCFTLNVFDET